MTASEANLTSSKGLPLMSPGKSSSPSHSSDSHNASPPNHDNSNNHGGQRRSGSIVLSPSKFRPVNHRRSAPIPNEAKKFECENCHQIFDRKCEWNKHMDKHERPYKCERAQCAKLLGFTYSGGLLRHEREVHGLHGGPKEQLFCPIKHCKRHMEQGFTRRENLQEHMRRVHKLQDFDGADVPTQAQDVHTPGTVASEHDSDDGSQSRKRKRMSIVSQGEDTLDDNLRDQVKRLRQENSELKSMWETQRTEISSQRDEIREIKQQLRQFTSQQAQLRGWRPSGTE